MPMAWMRQGASVGVDASRGSMHLKLCNAGARTLPAILQRLQPCRVIPRHGCHCTWALACP